MVRQKYIPVETANVYRGPAAPPPQKVFSKDSPFRCPEGRDEDVRSGGAGDWPTDGKNNCFIIANDDAASAADGMGVASWYQLNSRNDSATNAWTADPNYPGGAIGGRGDRICPFMGWQSSGTDPVQAEEPRLPAQPQHGQAGVEDGHDRRGAPTRTGGTRPRARSIPDECSLRRLGARHGKTHGVDGIFAYTNFAFFDGHVDLL